MYSTNTTTPFATLPADETPAIKERLTELESRLAFQEASIEELNQALIQQTLTITKLHQQLRLLAERLQYTQPSPLALAAEETLPPHY